MNTGKSMSSNLQLGHIEIKQQEAVLALHCSGGNSKQWEGLSQALGERYAFHAPEHIGTSPGSRWQSNQTLTLAEEAKASLKIIDETDQKVHLVGHSYGGALALHIALARPDRILSLSLYEPCAFHLLPKLGAFAREELTEISTIGTSITQQTRQGDYRGAMRRFVDYWNGEGAWLSMKPEHQSYLIQWAPNAINAFDALFSEEASFEHYRNLKVPTLLLQGELSPEPAHVVTAALQRLLPDSRRNRIAHMGHMGPLTHAATTNNLIAAFILQKSRNKKSILLRHHAQKDDVSIAA